MHPAQKYIFLLLLSLSCAASLAAETMQPSREERLSEHLSLLDVTSFAQDRFGHIWIGTLGGLNKYNGYEFEHFYNEPGDPASLSSDFVFTLHYESQQDRLWVGTISGLCRYNPEDEGFIRCVEGYSVYDIHQDTEGYLWLATPVGALRYDPESGESAIQRPGTDVKVYWEDDHGKLWMGTNGSGIGTRTHADVWEMIPVPQKRTVTCIFQAPDRNWWLGTDDGLLFFDPTTRTFVEPSGIQTLRQAVSHTGINFLREVEPMKVLVGTSTQGVYLYNILSQRLEHNKPSCYNPKRSSQAQCCFIDENGMVWIGTYDKGFFIAKKQSDYFCTDQTLNDAVRNKFCTRIVPGKDGAMWISTRYDGIFRYEKDGRYTYYSSDNLLYGNSVNDSPASGKDFLEAILIDSKGKIWAAFESCLVMGRVEGKRLAPEKKTMLRNVRTIKESENGTVWCGTWTGLYEVGKSGALADKAVCRIPGNVPEFIFQKDGTMLVSVYSDHIYTFEPGKGAPTALILPEPYAEIARNCITLSRDRRGNLWLGSYYHGMACIGADGNYFRLTEGDGLPSNNVLCFQEDNTGTMWASTHSGIVRIDPDKDRLRATTFNLRSLFPGEQYHEKSGGISTGGVLFFGGNHGVTYFHPADIPANTDAPRINIEDLKVFNKSLTPQDVSGLLTRDINHTREVVLGHSQKTITIDYAGIDYFSSNNLSYRYQLEGLDKEPVSVGTHRRASYPNLPSGKYTFRVWAIGEDGQTSTAPAELGIRIKKSPWVSTPALALYIVLLLLFLSSLIMTLTVVKKNRAREEQARQAKEKELGEIIKRSMTALSERDRHFLQQLDEVVRREIANPDFNVDTLATEMGFSRTALFNRVKSLAGMPPKDFIRNYRFKMASTLIQEGNLSLTEIADKTGFNSYSYFSKAFKQHFGISPKDMKASGIPDEKRAGLTDQPLDQQMQSPNV